jgi:hypothetical protein
MRKHRTGENRQVNHVSSGIARCLSSEGCAPKLLLPLAPVADTCMPALLKDCGVYWKRFPLLMSYSGSRDRLRKETLMAILYETSLDTARGFCFINLL